MIPTHISTVMWPPGYYIMRDRIPFFLTLVYMHRKQFNFNLDYLGALLLAMTSLFTGIAGAMYFKHDSMANLFGIHWSAPSPIEWGLFIIISTLLLYYRKTPIFESYYIAFITAMAGGWVYEFIPIIFYRWDYFVFFKINAYKVFFMEFQLLCLPILAYVIQETKKFKPHWLLLPTSIIFTAFSVFNVQIMQYFRDTLNYSYRWWVRLPTISLLFATLMGVYEK